MNGRAHKGKKHKPSKCGAWSPQPTPIVPPKGVKPMKDSTDIPTCGDAPGWNCAPHPLMNPNDYCNAVKAGSAGLCPVEFQPLEGLYAYLHYFYPGTNSYPTPSSTVRRNSYGFQYYSRVHQALRYDEVFLLDYNYDVANGTAKPGSELYESARATEQLLIDLSIPSKNIGVLNKDPGSCVFIPAPIWKLMNSDDLSNANITTYCGKTVFPKGYFTVGTTFDVYQVNDRWFDGIPIFWYINRQTGQIAGQLYYQTINGAQNYFWDFSLRLIPDSQAIAKFSQNPHYYFDINQDMVNRACSSQIASLVQNDQFPDKACCGPSYNCTACD